MSVTTALRPPTWFARTALFDVFLVGILAIAGVIPLLQPGVVSNSPGVAEIAMLAGIGFAVGQAIYVVATGLESVTTSGGVSSVRQTFAAEMTGGSLLSRATTERFKRACRTEFDISVGPGTQAGNETDGGTAEGRAVIRDPIQLQKFYPQVAAFVYSHGGGLYSTMQATFSFCRSMTLLSLILFNAYLLSLLFASGWAEDIGQSALPVPRWVIVVGFAAASVVFFAGYVKFRRLAVEYLVAEFVVYANG